MKQRAMTKEQLLNELGELRQRAAELEESALELQRAEETLQSEREKFQVLIEEAQIEILAGCTVVVTDSFKNLQCPMIIRQRLTHITYLSIYSS